ncbi:beta-galactosidase GanA [Streptacidiphilus sp. MAP12-16]|uniref:beta-galactosidase trimerization domain-containing protein n=1 Tax=Streptacidiphilus sp. MAP12-16 TaxID=3156300 RepID=UPI00351204B1
MLVVPGLQLAEESLLGWFASYAHAGGHLVLGPRTGHADQLARVWHEPAPARLTGVTGVTCEEYANLTADVTLRAVPGSPLALSADAVATRWVDGLAVDDAEVLADYDHPHFGRWPAVTTRRHGAGRVTCVGTVPGRELACALAPGSGRPRAAAGPTCRCPSPSRAAPRRTVAACTWSTIGSGSRPSCPHRRT